MCRLLAYLGPDISLYDLILSPEHSLEKQAWQPRELIEAKLNADGFGIGWYNRDRQPARYRQPIPIWNDPNLQDFSHSLQRPLWLAMVRSATPGLGIHHANTQPFIYQHWQFLHNGYINEFASSARPQFRQILHHEFEANITGSTDSEYIFALLLHFLQQQTDPIEAIRTSFHTIAEIIGEERAMLNIMLSDGERIIATRYAIHCACPSLYYGQSINGFPTSSQCLASEALSQDDNWVNVDDNSLLILRPNQPLEQLPL